jgi:hypothetical protein
MKLTAALTAAALAAAAIATPASGCETGHWINKVLDHGHIVILEDHSTWEIDYSDRINSGLWLTTSNVVVCDDKLINVDDGNAVRARRLR